MTTPTLTSSAEYEIHQLLQAMMIVFVKYKQYLHLIDQHKFELAMQVYYTLLEDGYFHPDVDLSDARWCPRANYRHGLNSIRGFYGEVCSCIIWNSICKNGTKFRLGSGDQHDESVLGRDLEVTNSRWRSSYYAQVKCVPRLPEFVMRARYIKYSADTLDRLVFVDITAKSMLQVPYGEFQSKFQNYDNQMISFSQIKKEIAGALMYTM